MDRFRTFITEELDPAAAFDRARAISIYLAEPRKSRYTDALDSFISASRDKEIYNARFQELYTYGLSRGLEVAWETCRDLIDRETTRNLDWDMYSFSSLAGLKKFEKAWLPHKNQYPKQWAFIEAIRDLPEAVKILKSYVVKGKPKAELKPGQFIKPMASVEAHKKAMEFLKEAVASFKEELFASVTDQFTRDLEKLKTYKTTAELEKAPEAIKHLAPRVSGYKLINGARVIHIHSDAKETIETMSKRITDGIIEEFIAKNTSKLALIFQKKADIAEHKIVHTRIQANTLENTMFFKFGDNSSFRIVSSVVFKRSAQGRYFSQFPTRFSDVVMADGSKMSMPSEEKMVKEF